MGAINNQELSLPFQILDARFTPSEENQDEGEILLFCGQEEEQFIASVKLRSRILEARLTTNEENQIEVEMDIFVGQEEHRFIPSVACLSVVLTCYVVLFILLLRGTLAILWEIPIIESYLSTD